MLIADSIRRRQRLSWLLIAIGMAFLVLILTISVAAKPTESESTIVYLQGPVGLVHVGDEITVTVGISDVVNLYGMSMDLDFVPDDLQVVDANGVLTDQIIPGECPAPDFVVSNFADNSAGTINYGTTQLNPTPPFSGNCNMAYIRFQTLQVTTTMIQFSQVLLSDPNGVPIPHTTVDLILDIVPPPPEAQFSGSPTSGIAPLLVDFTNLSTGVYDTCSWDFGDGNTSTECQDPSNNYTAGGDYTVSLTVDGPGGSSTETKVEYIATYEPVFAAFSGSPTSGIAILQVDFINDSTGDFATCSWDFGDSGTSEDCDDPSHNYTSGGVYAVSLTVTGFGGSDTETKAGYITVYDPAVAAFSGSPTSGIAPHQVNFVDMSSGDYDTCTWIFGDGNTSSTCANPSNNYTAGGVYEVSLTVSGLGGSDTETKTDYITVYEPVSADFSGSPTTGIAPHLVDFVDTSTGDYDTCAWDFGDNGTSDDCDDPSHNYTVGGIYTVTLTVSGFGGSDTETKTGYITVYDPALADFSATPTNGAPPLMVEFVNLSTGDFDACDWDFGDGNTSTICVDPSNEYAANGVYTVRLTVSGLGGSDTETKTSYITVVDTYFSYIPVIVKPS